MSPRIGLSQKMIVDAAAEIADQEGLNGVTLAALSKKMMYALHCYIIISTGCKRSEQSLLSAD